MRLRRIDLTRHGPFEDRTLIFEPEAPLTVIYGPNEAGKSSFLRALKDLLFGFEHEAGHANFRYDYKRLEIGAEIEAAGGERLFFKRLKRARGDLVDASGAALEPGALAPFLGATDRDAFEQLFGLDAEGLRAHGRRLLEDGGALGESLLSAGALLGGLHRRRDALDKAADGIFAGRKAGHRRFYGAQEAWRSARSLLKERALTRTALKDADAALAEASARRRAAEAALEELAKTRARDERVIASARVLPELDAARAAAAALGAAPEPALVTAAEAALKEAEAARRGAEEAMRRTDQARAALEAEPEPGPALRVAKAIEAAVKAAAAAEAGRREKAEHEAALAEITQRKAQLARRLGCAEAGLEEAAPSEAVRKAAMAALRRLEAARRGSETAQDALRRAEARTEQAARGPTRVSDADLAQARSARDADWAMLRAEINAGAAPQKDRLDRHESLTRGADLAADTRIAAAGETATFDAAAAALREAEEAAVAADAALAEATDGLRPLAARLTGAGWTPADTELEPAVEGALEAWRSADALFEDEAKLARRGAHLAEGGATLAEAAAVLAAELGEPAPSDPTQAVERWAGELRAAEAAAERRKARAERLRDDQAALEEAKRRRDAATAALQTIAKRLDVGDAAEIAAEIARAEQVAAAAATLRHAEQRFIDASDGRDENALRAELATTDRDAAAARLAAMETRWREAKAENDAAVAAEAEARAARTTLSADQGAATAARQEEDAAAEMALAAEEWLTLRAASLLLTEAARRYRDQTANPVLTRAAALFRALTCGGFETLTPEMDEKGAERIIAVRAEGAVAPGERVGVEALSEGARDQLFLALRLAAIERWAEDRPAPPFVADDLFASFDEARMVAGLEALAALGATTQCLALTHHAHVADAASAHLGERAQIIHL